MNILVTGGTGFLGSYIIKRLYESKHRPILLKRKRSSTSRLEGIIHSIKQYDLDATDLSVPFKEQKIEGIIHTATHYGRNENEVENVIQANLSFPLALARLAVEHQVGCFINTDTFINSSAYDYSYLKLYTLTKKTLWEYLTTLFRNEQTKFINLKLFHPFGPGDHDSKFIPWFIKQALKGDRIALTEGIQQRDFIYISDVASAFESIIDNYKNISNFESFDVGRGEGIELREFLSIIVNQLKKRGYTPPHLAFGELEFRKGEIMNSKADISKLNRLRWSPEVSIIEGIEKTINEFTKE